MFLCFVLVSILHITISFWSEYSHLVPRSRWMQCLKNFTPLVIHPEILHLFLPCNLTCWLLWDIHSLSLNEIGLLLYLDPIWLLMRSRFIKQSSSDGDNAWCSLVSIEMEWCLSAMEGKMIEGRSNEIRPRSQRSHMTKVRCRPSPILFDKLHEARLLCPPR